MAAIPSPIVIFGPEAVPNEENERRPAQCPQIHFLRPAGNYQIIVLPNSMRHSHEIGRPAGCCHSRDPGLKIALTIAFGLRVVISEFFMVVP